MFKGVDLLVFHPGVTTALLSSDVAKDYSRCPYGECKFFLQTVICCDYVYFIVLFTRLFVLIKHCFTILVSRAEVKLYALSMAETLSIDLLCKNRGNLRRQSVRYGGVPHQPSIFSNVDYTVILKY